ncbi:MAG TPA: type II toxin-antitoxin system VapC family toxin [Bryobacteraceae bacterium]|nr:type II toxin-antitoxin system VapC family toxin [Bryobacteraceae bacterium]
MIIIDVSLLIYAVNQDSPDHQKAKSWLEAAISGTETVGLPWIVLLAFLRLTTRAGIFQKPLRLEAAFDLVGAWIEQPSVTVPEPTTRHLQTMRDLISPLGTGGNLISDAHLAALAIEHGAELCTADNDFGRFRRLRWRNPLTG